MFKFYLDNTQVSDPVNWQDFSETIERDDLLKCLLPKYEIKLTFSGDAFAYLYNQFSLNGYCKLVNFQVDFKCSDHYEKILKGFIFISDCRFNLNKCTVECDIIDDNYSARIFNNKNLEAKLDVGFSKNGIAIAPAASVNMNVYDVNNTFLYQVDAYHIKEAFRFLIDFMSDGTIGFESDYLTLPFISAAPIRLLYLINGKELRLHLGDAPIISFQQLFEETNKKFPIAFTIIAGSDGRPTIKLEQDEYFYKSATGVVLENIDDLIQSFNTEKLYSSIRLGSPAADFDPALGDFPIIRFLSFVDETFQLQGECNIDKVLDLSGIFISDSNIIQRITATDTSSQSYDEDTVWMESSFGIDTNLYNSPITNAAPYYYNAHLTNNMVAERYALANNIAFYLGNNIENFRAQRTSFQNLGAVGFDYYSPAIIFQDDFTPPNFDTAGVYNNTNGRYVSATSGVYGFEALIKFAIVAAVPGTTFTYAVAYRLYDSGGSLQATYICATTTNVISAGNYSVIGNKSINVIAGFYVTAHLYMDVALGSGKLTSLNAAAGSYFKTTSVQNGGGIYEYKDPGNYFVSKFEFDQPLSHTKYQQLKLDLSASILFNHGPLTNKVGWLRKTTRNLATGEMSWELVSNLNSSN